MFKKFVRRFKKNNFYYLLVVGFILMMLVLIGFFSRFFILRICHCRRPNISYFAPDQLLLLTANWCNVWIVRRNYFNNNRSPVGSPFSRCNIVE